jgi:hypothetical protein
MIRVARRSTNIQGQQTRPVSFAHVMTDEIEPPLPIPGNPNTASVISTHAISCNFGHTSRTAGAV